MHEERGREAMVSTGRGGAGNVVRESSVGPEADGAYLGQERGREFSPNPIQRVTHAGRGGAGNVRSPSRDPKRDALEEAQEEALQEKLLAERRGRQADAPYSSGRGGAGNIAGGSRSRSRARDADGADRRDASATGKDGSRSRSRVRDIFASHQHAHSGPVHAGRGGYGNITEEATEESIERRRKEDLYEASVKKKFEASEAGHVHSVGRGGAGSVGQSYEHVDASTIDAEERAAHAKLAAAQGPPVIRGGRGGAGNYVPKEGEDRGRAGNNSGGGGMFGSMLRSLSRAAGREAQTAPVKPAAR